MAIYEVLYVNDSDEATKAVGYKKIVVMKPAGWKWGPGELNTKFFKIVKMEVDDKIVADIYNRNAYCVAADEKSVAAVSTDKMLTVKPHHGPVALVNPVKEEGKI